MAPDPLMRLGVLQLLGGAEPFRNLVPVELVGDLPDAPADDAVVILVAPMTSVMRQVCGRLHTLVVLSSPAPALIRAAVQAGAKGVVSSATSSTQLRIALDVAASGGLYLCNRLSARLRASADRVVPLALAPRELETLELVAGGLTHAQAARALGLAEATVSGYITRVRAKLHVGTRAELARQAMAFGLVR